MRDSGSVVEETEPPDPLRHSNHEYMPGSVGVVGELASHRDTNTQPDRAGQTRWELEWVPPSRIASFFESLP